MLKKKIARIISELSNGFLTMILVPITAIVSSPISSNNKIIYSAVYILAPLLPYAILKNLGKISDYEFTKREERPPYFVIISILFGLMYFQMKSFNIEILSNVSLTLFVVSSVITFITFFWKISGHMTYSTILFVTLIYIFHSPYLLLLFLLSPFIAWSRIVLEKHTLTQVSLGTLLPLAISILIYWGF
ncbi:MAG: hypothetical protein AB9915_02535 [Candidatus Dojkabacteria bacterium]